ncbi:hypothetical protein ACFTZJ_05640 [Streptomyces globisporus]|uniref:hypothetical protein n=1 Tax=Streptomyces globisporus TaxID=1908 RepID=UPI003637DC1E
MTDKHGKQQPHSSPASEEIRSSGEKEKRSPNLWAAGSFALNLWRFLRDRLNGE